MSESEKSFDKEKLRKYYTKKQKRSIASSSDDEYRSHKKSKKKKKKKKVKNSKRPREVIVVGSDSGSSDFEHRGELPLLPTQDKTRQLISAVKRGMENALF
jgi:hypothetical protein